MKIFIVLCFYTINYFEFIKPETVRYWGDICFLDNDCTDHRLSCMIDPTSGAKKCQCDSFHIWDKSLQYCKPRYNTTHMLTLLQEQHNTIGWIEKEAIIIFNGAMFAGSFVILVVVLCFLSIILYCFQVRKSDKKLKASVKLLTDHTNGSHKTKVSQKRRVKTEIIEV